MKCSHCGEGHYKLDRFGKCPDCGNNYGRSKPMIYKTWDTTFRKSDATKKVNKYKSKGLEAKVIKKKNAYAPRGYSYEVKVGGSLFNVTKKRSK